MAKNKDEGISLVAIAEEMNKVMAYGQDPKTGQVDESELIDIDLSDKVLKAEIIKRAKEDLRAGDKPDFTPEAWQFFIDEGVTPAGSEDDDPDNGGSDDAPEGDDSQDDEAPAKGKGKSDKKAEKGEKKKGNVLSRAMVEGGNEAFAKRLVKEKTSWDDFLAAFHDLYVKAGKKDEKYIQSRARIYWNIAHKALGLPVTDGPKKAEPEKKSAKAEKAEKGDKKADAKGKGGKSKK